MRDFTFSNATEIIFGRDAESQIAINTKKYGKKVLLHFGGGSIKRSGLFGQITESLQQAGVDYLELGGVAPNPRLGLVKQGVALCREAGVDFILAVGGGSVIDSAKAIAMGVPYCGDVWDFYTGKATPTEIMPIGVVLTITAAGSEASNGSVITSLDGLDKRDAVSELMRPKFAIMNPERTFTLPPYQTSCGISDIMAHVMERYFTRTRHVALTDRLCEAVLKTVIQNAPVVLREPENYDARAEIMWAGTIAHNDLLSTGRTGDWASHDIELPISAVIDIAHGAGLSIIFPAWMKYVYQQDIQRFAQFAVRVWNVEQDYDDMERTAYEGIASLERFYQSIGLPVRLHEIGIGKELFERITQHCKFSSEGTVGHFVKLKEADIMKILSIAK